MGVEVLTRETLETLQREANKVSVGDYLAQWWRREPFLSAFDKNVLHIKPNDCPIVAKFAQVETFPVSGMERVREVSLATFWAPHPLREFHKRSLKSLGDDVIGLRNAQDQLAKIDSLPVLVFMHGLGGQMSQFEPLLQEFRNCADIFAFDLPGFGCSKRATRNDSSNNVNYSSLSSFSKDDQAKIEKTLDELTWGDYDCERVSSLVWQILEHKFPNRRFVFITHSMGTHTALRVLSRLDAERVESVVMMTPPRLSHTGERAIDRLPVFSRAFLTVCSYAPRLFDWYRLLDRQGGFNSHSVRSYLSQEGTSGGGMFKRLTQYRWNLDTDSEVFLKYLWGFRPMGDAEFKEAVKHLCNDTKTRVLVIGAAEDKVTPVAACESMTSVLQSMRMKFKYEVIEGANHSLFLDKPNVLSGIVYDFVEDLGLNISCTWVLQVKATISGDKWGLKNKEKWDKVVTLSAPLVNRRSPEKPKSHLLAMKTLRQSDPLHNPRAFEQAHPDIFAVVDIGSDTPAYDPLEFERIHYVKFKTESKVIPDNVTIVKFVGIVEGLMAQRGDPSQSIVVHCHYGQNRTGFLICCFLIEKLGWTPSEAIEAFETSKAPGIKHVHFKNALHLRYR